jgi:hypothetical protein
LSQRRKIGKTAMSTMTLKLTNGKQHNGLRQWLYAVLPNVEELDIELSNFTIGAYNPDSLLEMKNHLGRNKPLGTQRAAITGKLYCLTMQNCFRAVQKEIFFFAISRHPLYSRQKAGDAAATGLKRHSSLKHAISLLHFVSIY